MKLLFKNETAKSRESLVSKITDMTKMKNYNVTFVFESEDYSKYLNPTYRKQAFHMNIKSGGVEEMSPQDLLEIMKNSETKHLVWVSNKICEAEEIYFAWVLSHEIQHLIQDERDSEISFLGNFLLGFLGCVKNGASWVEVPTEYDSERTAKFLVYKLFGKAQLKKYIEKQLADPQNVNTFRRYEALTRIYSKNIKAETVKILCKYRREFEKLQSDSKNRVQIDFDYYCKKTNESI